MFESHMLNILVALLISFFCIILLLKTPLIHLAIDTPNERSLHTKLTPRTGGLAVMVGVLIAWLMLSVNWYWLFLPFSLMVISFIDDIKSLSAKSRLLAQLLISFILVLIICKGEFWLFIAIAVILLTWMTNLYNFMDGSDGLAGGMGLIGFMAYAVNAYLMGNELLALMSACISAACLAFLIFNFHPAKIFMGDAGSIPLGFLVGAIGLYGYKNQVWPAWFPFLVFSPFVVDATVTLIKRLIKKEKVWQAHKSHYYQKLIQLGWGHRKTALVEYMLMLCVALSAVALTMQNALIVVIGLLIWALVYYLIMRNINALWQEIKTKT